ncbi:MAG: ABC transporter permease [Reichenbachiella sp.]
MNFQLFKLAWRNIWRNKRRAFITISSIVASLVLVLLMRQMQIWTYDNNTDNSISGYVGYIQITDSTYVDEQILDNTILASQVPVEEILKIDGVKEVLPRFQSGALMSTGIKSRFAGVLGILPSIDNEGLDLDKKLFEGELLTDQDMDILITESMAKFYQTKVGDSLVMLSSGYQGYTAAGVFRIKGIVKFPAGDMANMVFMSIPTAQYIFAAPDRYTAFLVNLDQSKGLDSKAAKVRELIADQSIAVRTWEEVLPGLKQGLEVDSASGIVMASILYMIVGFGILGTIVMLYNERLFEFGVLSAIGMKRSRLLLSVLIELNLLTIIGILAANVLSLPILYYYNINPIELGGEMAESVVEQGFEPLLGMGLYFDVFLANSFAVWLISLVVSGYIIFKIMSLDALQAMRQN